MMRNGNQATHLQSDGTTVIVASGAKGYLQQVIVGNPANAGTATIRHAGAGATIAVLDLTVVGEYSFDLDLRQAGVEVVIAGVTSGGDVTVISEG